MLNRIIAVSYIFFIATSSMVLFMVALVIWLVTVLFDKRLYILHLFSSFWASLYLWVMPPWSVSIEGRENIRKKTYIVVSNHQSILDILVAFRIFFHFKWVSKAEIFKIPFLGWNMSLNRYIKLVRGDKKSIQRMMQECNKALSNGNSIYIFPEGTRSETGQLKRFRAGAFLLAKGNKLPILPIAISGTHHALPKRSLNFHGKHKIKVKILEEIPYETFENLTVAETADMVRGYISEHLGPT
jgi:1-acyl-sn-glycerol-3-phosphate acyltransferase